jgi:cell division protein FtsQ
LGNIKFYITAGEQMRSLASHEITILKLVIKTLLVMSFLFVGLWKITAWMGDSATLPIYQVRVEGNLQFLSQQDVAEAVGDLVSTGYFSVDKQQIIEKLELLPWIKHAHVARIWPDTVVLNVSEHDAYAYWNNDSLLSVEGVIYTPQQQIKPEGLPKLAGMDSQSGFVVQQYKKTNQGLASEGAHLVALSRASHGSWKGVLSNGVTLDIGHQEPSSVVTKGVNMLTSFNGSILDRVEGIDLRYPNGISVSWKEGFLPDYKKAGAEAFEIQQIKLIKG